MSEHFDEPELQDAEPVTGCRVQSTPQTRERFASVKTKRKGQVWEEDGSIYRMGPTGVTVFKRSHLLHN